MYSILLKTQKLKSSPGRNTIKVVTAKPPLNKSLNQCVFTARFYNFIVLDTILKSRQLFNGDFIATFSEEKIIVHSEPARILLQFYRFCKAVHRDSSLKQTNKMYLYTLLLHANLSTKFVYSSRILTLWDKFDRITMITDQKI